MLSVVLSPLFLSNYIIPMRLSWCLYNSKYATVWNCKSRLICFDYLKSMWRRSPNALQYDEWRRKTRSGFQWKLEKVQQIYENVHNLNSVDLQMQSIRTHLIHYTHRKGFFLVFHVFISYSVCAILPQLQYAIESRST